MKKFLVAVALCLSSLAVATPNAEAQFAVGADAAMVVPIGNWADASGLGFGALLRAEAGLALLTVTARVGYIHHVAADLPADSGTANTRELPLLLGIKASIFGPIYAGLELGLINTWVSVTLPNGTSSETSGFNFGGTFGIGASMGPFDGRISLFAPDFGEFEDLLGVLVTAGYNFL